MFFRSWYSVPRGWSQLGEERVTAGQSHKACEQSVASYLRGLLPSFSLYFLGLLAVRVWLQSAVYDRYLSTDAGFITVASNVIRVVFIAILLAVAVRQGFPERRLSALAVVSVVSMTAASVLFLFELETGITWLMWPACLLAGFGIIWGGGMWMRFYERLRPGGVVVLPVPFSCGQLCHRVFPRAHSGERDSSCRHPDAGNLPFCLPARSIGT